MDCKSHRKAKKQAAVETVIKESQDPPDQTSLPALRQSTRFNFRLPLPSSSINDCDASSVASINSDHLEKPEFDLSSLPHKKGDIRSALEIIVDVCSAMINSKETVPKKQRILEALGRIAKIHSDLQAEITDLRTENRRLKETRSQPQTYSRALVAPPPRTQTITTPPEVKAKHVVLIDNPDPNLKTADDVKNSLIKDFRDSAEDWQVVALRRTRGPRVILETTSPAQVAKILNSKELQDKGYRISKPEKRRPKLIVKDVPHGTTEADLKRAIKNALPGPPNDNPLDELVSFRFKLGRLPDRDHWVWEAHHTIWKTLIDKGRLFLGFRSCRVEDYASPARCYRCHNLGHTAKVCRADTETCGYCAKPGHRFTDCPRKKLDPPVCALCTRYGKDPRHSTTDPQCPSRLTAIKRLRDMTDYGNG